MGSGRRWESFASHFSTFPTISAFQRTDQHYNAGKSKAVMLGELTHSATQSKSQAALHDLAARRCCATPHLPGRVTPHIYQEAEIVALLNAAHHMDPPNSLRPATFETLFGLIACAGLRVSEPKFGSYPEPKSVKPSTDAHLRRFGTLTEWVNQNASEKWPSQQSRPWW